MNNFGVIGGGSWATAIVKMFNSNGITVNWWVRDEKQAEHIQTHGHNNKYLSAAELNSDYLKVSTDLNLVIETSNVLIVATPSAFIHRTLKNSAFNNKKIVSAVKGIIPETNEIPAEYFNTQFDVDLYDFAIICGPCHAEEVAMERLSYLSIGSQDEGFAETLAAALSCRFIQCSTSNDVVGMEISAILKNVYAIASGIAHGLGYGDNFLSVLVSNAIQEIERFIDHKYPVHRDVKLSAYLGDLLVTAYSPHSRNRRFGNMLGKGYSVDSIKQEMNMVAEGYFASACIEKMNENEIDLPIANTVYQIMYESKNPRLAFKKLEKELS